MSEQHRAFLYFMVWYPLVLVACGLFGYYVVPKILDSCRKKV